MRSTARAIRSASAPAAAQLTKTPRARAPSSMLESVAARAGAPRPRTICRAHRPCATQRRRCRARAGLLPPSLGQLDRVHTVFLHVNGFRGSIPSSLGQCRSLRNLQLWSNRLEGPVPSSLARLEHIELLVLCGNAGLRGAEPIAEALRERRNMREDSAFPNQYPTQRRESASVFCFISLNNYTRN